MTTWRTKTSHHSRLEMHLSRSEPVKLLNLESLLFVTYVVQINVRWSLVSHQHVFRVVGFNQALDDRAV